MQPFLSQLFLAHGDHADVATEVIVTWRDLQSILPSLILFATGTIVLLLDCFTRNLSGTVPAASKSAGSDAATSTGSATSTVAMHFIALLGTAIAAAFVCSNLQASDTEGTIAGTFFTNAIRVDTFGSVISLLIVGGAFLSLLVSIDYLRRFQADHGEFQCLVLFAAGSLVLFAQSNNLVMAFLSLETLSMDVYVLTSFLRDSKRSVEGGLKYFVLGGFSTGFLLFGFTLLFGATRQIEFPAMAQTITAGLADVPLLLAGLALSIVGLGFKVGAFPFHSWVPDAYEGAPTVSTGFMAVTVKAAGFAVLLRILVLLATGSELQLENGAYVSEIVAAILTFVAIGTMIFGNFVALVQNSVKRMLAYSAIGHTGYLLVGVVVALSPQGRDTAIGSVLFYLVPYSLMTLAAFTLIGYMGTSKHDRESFEEYRGLAQQRPIVAFLLLVILVSFAGIPPTAGFWGKLYLFRAAIATDHYALAFVGILTSVVSVYFYLRLVVNFYMKPADEDFLATPVERRLASGVVIAAAAIAIVLLGLFPDALFELSASSAASLGR